MTMSTPGGNEDGVARRCRKATDCKIADDDGDDDDEESGLQACKLSHINDFCLLSLWVSSCSGGTKVPETNKKKRWQDGQEKQAHAQPRTPGRLANQEKVK